MEVVNAYTYRQAMSLVNYIIKDKFAVIAEVLKSFDSSSKPSPSTSPSPRAGCRLPSWYRPKQGARIRVVDLDGPMSDLMPYVGKGKVVRGRKKK
jgi:hypothetical protein